MIWIGGRARVWHRVLQVNPNFDDPDRLASDTGEIDSAIKAAGGRTVFLVTWRLQRRLASESPWTLAWSRVAERLGTLHAPAGRAWELALRSDSGLPLYDPDGGHPAPMGSYLAACVIYLVIQPDQNSCPAIGIAGARSEHFPALSCAAMTATSMGKREK